MRILLPLLFLAIFSCNNKEEKIDKEQIKKEIVAMENEFATFLKDSGVALAFAKYAAGSAVIKRENDTLIIGREAIRNYYARPNYADAVAEWAPDFTDVSEDGTMAYTYGKYKWYFKDTARKDEVYTGVFHTVWKKMEDGSWKYVWD